MHPGYAGGYAMSMYPGMGPYPTAMPAAVAYPPSPVLNPSLAPAAGFSVPSSSNSSRQTSLSEPLPRPVRERRPSAPSSKSPYSHMRLGWPSPSPLQMTKEQTDAVVSVCIVH